jgi:diguanylate cyclase (GGDEF)-like protein
VVNRRLLADVLALKNELEIMATHDPLTGLPNRSLFHDRFAVALENAKRSKSRLAIMYIDIDNFKEINDTQGHAAGDELLVESARRLTRALRKVDTVARFGGDEFVLLLWDVEADDDARDIAEKILTELRKPFGLDGRHVSVSGSIGIALYPKDGVDADGLIKKADEALYLAKTSGKGGYRFILS